MGFRAPGTGQKLDFSGTQYEGLEITIGSVPIGMVTSIAKDYDALSDGKMSVAKGAEVLESLLGSFAAVLEGWNVEDKDDRPVPATREGIDSLDSTFVLGVIGAWITGTTQASPELGKGSPSGGASPEELAAMAALSQSLPSL